MRQAAGMTAPLLRSSSLLLTSTLLAVAADVAPPLPVGTTLTGVGG